MQSNSVDLQNQENLALLQRLSQQRITKLREIGKKLSIGNVQGKKEEIVNRLFELLITEEGIKKVKELNDQEFFEAVLQGPQNLSQTLVPKQGESLTTLGKGTITVQGKAITIKCVCQSGPKPLIQCSTCKN